MRCKANELAVIISGVPVGNIGKIVTTIRATKVYDIDIWYVDGKLGKDGLGRTCNMVADSCLRPIRDQDGEDECLHAHIRKETHEQQKAAGLAALQHFGVRL